MADDFPDATDLSASSEPLQAALRDLQGLADGFGRAMTTAFRRSVMDGKRLEDVLRSLALGLSGRALNAALAPLSRGLSGAIGNLFGGLAGARPFAQGGVVGSGVSPFSSGPAMTSTGWSGDWARGTTPTTTP